MRVVFPSVSAETSVPPGELKEEIARATLARAGAPYRPATEDGRVRHGLIHDLTDMHYDDSTTRVTQVVESLCDISIP